MGCRKSTANRGMTPEENRRQFRLLAKQVPVKTARQLEESGVAVRTDDAIGVQFFALAAVFDFQAQATFNRPDTEKARIKRKACSRVLRFAREGCNQTRTLDNQIRFLEGNLRGAAIGEKFKAADFIDDAILGDGGHLRAEMIGNNEGAGRRFKLRLGFQHANGAPAAGYAGGGEESGG